MRAILGQLLAHKPSLTREEFLAFVKDAWPAARGPRRRARAPLFSPSLLLGAYRALLREHPSGRSGEPSSWGDRAARQELGAALRVDPRTIGALLALARGNNR
jgi:hypothetical protein